MGNILVEKTNKVSEQDLMKFLNMNGFSNINPKTKTDFIKLSMALGLNPFKKEIYITGYKTKTGQEVYSVVTGYQTFIKIANKSKLLNGWNVKNIYDNGKLIGAKITIFRKDWEYPFEWEVFRDEFDKGQSTWKSMPSFMLRKVAIGQGFKLCFEGVADMSGLYEEAEIIGEETPELIKGNVVPKKLDIDILNGVKQLGLDVAIKGNSVIVQGNTFTHSKSLKSMGFEFRDGEWSMALNGEIKNGWIKLNDETLAKELGFNYYEDKGLWAKKVA